MNKNTAASIYDNFSDEEKDKVLQLKKSGMKGIMAISQVHAGKVGDVARAAQPDLDAVEKDRSIGGAYKEGFRRLMTGGPADPNVGNPLETFAAAAQGVGRAAGFGLDDEVAGAAHALAPWNLIPAVVNQGDKSTLDTVGDLYRSGRDEQRDANESIDRGTDAAQAGSTAFTVLSPLMPSGAASQAAKAAPTVGRAVLEGAKVGGASGALAGFGQDEGDVTANTLGSALAGGGLGALLGGVGGLANPEARAATTNGLQESALGQKLRGIKDSGGAAKAAADITEQLPLVGKPFGAARKAWNADVMTPEQAGATIDTGPIVDDVVPFASDVGTRADVSSGLDLAPRSPAALRAATQQIDDVTRELPGLARGKTSAEMRSMPDLEAEARSFEGGTGDINPSRPDLAGPAKTQNARTPPKTPAPSAPSTPEELRAATAAIDEGSKTMIKRSGREWQHMSDDDKLAALEQAAKKATERFGSPDRAAIQQATGMSPSDLDRLLPQVTRRLAPTPDVVDMPAGPSQSTLQRSLSSMLGETAQDLGTRAPSMQAAVAPKMGPPSADLVDYFIQRGATREQALAQAHAVMAKMFATPQGAVGRQRSASPFPTGQPQAKIATPKGRNRSSAPFNE